jgi:ribonuclease E
LLSEFADAMDYMYDGSNAAGSSGSERNNAAGGQGIASNASKASYTDEGTLKWGTDADGDVKMGGMDEGSAAAQSMLQQWQSEGQPGEGGKQYAANPSTRSGEGLEASFDFDAGPGFASADSLLGQLPDAESLAGLQQQQQQQQQPAAAAAAPKRKGRAGTTSRRAKKTDDTAADDDGAAARSRRKTSTRKAAPAGNKEQQGPAAAAADAPLDGWVGGADSSDEGFEAGWADRMMDDGNNRPGLDDVMRS